MAADNRRSEFMVEIRRRLEEAGNSVEFSSSAQRASGAGRHFDLVARKDAKTVPIDVRFAEKGAVEFADILDTYTKILGGKSRPCIVIAVPHASSDARKAAVAFGLILVEGDDVSRVAGEVDAALSSIQSG